jgi:hypothetical protein
MEAHPKVRLARHDRLGRKDSRTLPCGAPRRERKRAMWTTSRDGRVRLARHDTKNNECWVEELWESQTIS